MYYCNVLNARSRLWRILIQKRLYDADNVPEPWLAFADEEDTFVKAPIDIGRHVDEKHDELALSTSDVDAIDVMITNNEADPVETPAWPKRSLCKQT